MLRSETVASTALGYVDTSYAVVEGRTQNDVLERELLFCTELDELKSEGMILCAEDAEGNLALIAPEADKNVNAAVRPQAFFLILMTSAISWE